MSSNGLCDVNPTLPGLYRFAQAVQDARAPSVSALFAWASRGELPPYVSDTNNATTARDDLKRTTRLVFDRDAEQERAGAWIAP